MTVKNDQISFGNDTLYLSMLAGVIPGHPFEIVDEPNLYHCAPWIMLDVSRSYVEVHRLTIARCASRRWSMNCPKQTAWRVAKGGRLDSPEAAAGELPIRIRTVAGDDIWMSPMNAGP